MRLKRTIFLLILSFSCLTINKAWATHERAGYITWQYVPNKNNTLTYKFTVVTFTKESSYLADRQFLTVFWGDGTSDSLPRIDTFVYLPRNEYDIKRNEYVGYHTYSGPATYEISMTDQNRITGIVNIENGNSVYVPLCLVDTMTLLDPANFGFDSSPVILNPPIQFGDVGQTFIYNPNAYDPDGDSLSYSLMPPKQQPNYPQDVPGYLYPDQIASGANNKESIDPVTGTYTWNAPQLEGIYNIAILVTEYRKKFGRFYKIGSIDIDLQIIINASFDHPPLIKPLRDTCIIAGETLNIKVISTDPDTGQIVSLQATGTPFEVDSPYIARFTILKQFESHTVGVNDTTIGNFLWTTNCDHIRNQEYTVVFTATDSYVPPLDDQVTWNIHVIAPPPDSLTDTATGNAIILNWKSPYSCAGASTFLGFTIWRKAGCTPLVPDTCDPASELIGYTELTHSPILAYTYADNSVLQGIDYSYLVVAEFGDTTSVGYIYNQVYGLASNAVCAYLKKDVPVITNVSVTTTAVTTGKMHIAWSKPSQFINGVVVFDTTEFPGPYKYGLYRSSGFTNIPSAYIDSFKANSFYQFSDTTYEDTQIDTKDSPYVYRVKFYWHGGDSLVGSTNIASSIYLTLVGNNHQVALSWFESVPWTNDSFVVYRQNHITHNFDSIATTTVQSYTDHGLYNDTTYCYYVKSIGRYAIEGITNPLIDSSQVNCTVPVDTTRPCSPVLAVYNNCNSTFNYGNYVNQLIWTLNKSACANSSILKFYIYYSALENLPLQLIDSTVGPTDTTYTSQLNGTLAGCYAVAAEDSGYTLSDKSNIFCVNNCPIYNLPNVFTPNGDEHNDVFTPMLPYQYIDHVDMHIFNRWGELVYETTDPMINWSGKDFKSGKDCPDGVYYYTCEVYESTVVGIIKRNPPLKGYIHLLR